MYPTYRDISHTPESLKEVLKGDEYKLYEMIWQRTLASQMKPAIFDSTRITFDFSKDYSFRANGSVLVFKGFLEVYQEGDEIDGEKDDDVRLPVIHNQDKLSPVSPPGVVCEEKQTKPPARYNEASLVRYWRTMVSVDLLLTLLFQIRLRIEVILL